jgi:hypothetical protein
MMLNIKYATAWAYYDGTMSMNVAWNSQLSLRNYSTCIWCMQNTCMNFVVYLCILLHIIMLLVVIIMFYNVLWGFSIDPPYFVITL